ncbi:hypothetical protein EB001_02185 [bacterium]|nr:hypothetical protein [bacterium]
MAVVTQIQVRRGTASSWTSANPTLAAGEFGFETDTGKVKIGTGSTAWTSLGYLGAGDVTLTGTQTLTNKTLTAPIITLATSAQTASYTLVLTDASDIVEMNNASANNLTIPLNSSVAFPTGTVITVLQTGAGQTTIVGTGGVTVNGTPGLKLRAQWSSATLIKRATDTWVAIGDLSA